MKIIKTYENYNFDDLKLGRFSHLIKRDKLIPNDDGTYDYEGNLDFNDIDWIDLKSLKQIPIRFNRVHGRFYLHNNCLISLEGAPRIVDGDFNCRRNNLISLQYAPEYIGQNFYCFHNFLLSSKHLSKVGWEFGNGSNSFEITDDVINTVKQMTKKQQIAELNFFEQHDKEAFEKMQKILIDLRVVFGSDYRKEITKKKMKTSDNLKSLGF